LTHRYNHHQEQRFNIDCYIENSFFQFVVGKIDMGDDFSVEDLKARLDGQPAQKKNKPNSD